MIRENQEAFANTDDTDIDLAAIREAIKPLLWRVLICPVQPRKLSKGGIALPDAVQDGEEHLNYIGRVVSMGPLAGRSEKFLSPAWINARDMNTSHVDCGPKFAWSVKEGDCVVYGRYSGQRMEWKGVKLVQVNDDEILAVVDSIESFRIYAA